jgi:hypothetical protein
MLNVLDSDTNVFLVKSLSYTVKKDSNFPRQSLVSDIPAGDGKIANNFLQCIKYIMEILQCLLLFRQNDVFMMMSLKNLFCCFYCCSCSCSCSCSCCFCFVCVVVVVVVIVVVVVVVVVVVGFS